MMSWKYFLDYKCYLINHFYENIIQFEMKIKAATKCFKLAWIVWIILPLKVDVWCKLWYFIEVNLANNEAVILSK